jgi:uncharacterized protein (TIGR02466 family)
MNRKQLFVTPVWEFELDGINNSRLESYAYQLQNQDDEKRYTNNYISGVNTYGIKWRSYYLSDAQIKSNTDLNILAVKITEAVNTCFADLNPKKDCRLHLNECWFNINAADEAVTAHLHPATTLVATYYINVPENSGNIVFQTGENSRYWNFPPKYFIHRNEYTEVLHQVESRENLLVVFPGNLMHSVQRNMSGKDRVCMTFNFGIKDTTPFSPNHRNFNKK